jgi:uncharacterized repeat protein (TIGR03806 family)
MKRSLIYILGLTILLLTACSGDRFDAEVVIPDFNFPKTITFEQKLSAYQIFEGAPADLRPAPDFQVLELSSILFTDYAHKQRLVKLPAGTKMTRLEDGSMDFPDGTILTKTFYYYLDERDTSLGKRIIETRLLIKESNTWNVATYLWNTEQTEATLTLEGLDTQVSWVNANGNNQTTLYHVPTENECMTCHQSKGSMSPIGPSLRNVNRMVERNGQSINQIKHLQALGVLNDFSLSQVPHMVDYQDTNLSIEERARAYLAMNCAHCHNPDGWEEPAKRDFDFRYELPLDQTGILYEKDKIVESLMEGEMPFIGTTLLDQEGLSLIIDFIDNL